MNFVNEKSEPKDLKYIHYQAENAYVFYSQFYQHKENCSFENDFVGSWDDRVSQLITNRSETEIWIIFSHFAESEITKIIGELNSNFDVIERYQETGASCYHLKRK